MLSGEQVCVTVHVGEHTVVLFSRCNWDSWLILRFSNNSVFFST
jgi:hypothetical protein